MPVYTHPNGLDYTEEQIQAAADKAEVSIDDYIKEKKLAPKKVKAKPIEQKSAFPITPELDILGVEKMKTAPAAKPIVKKPEVKFDAKKFAREKTLDAGKGFYTKGEENIERSGIRIKKEEEETVSNIFDTFSSFNYKELTPEEKQAVDDNAVSLLQKTIDTSKDYTLSTSDIELKSMELLSKANNKKKTVEGESYFERNLSGVAKGLNYIGEMFASVPETTYSLFALPQNAIAWATGNEDLVASPEKLKKQTGTSNPVMDYFIDEQKKIGKQNDIYDSANYDSTSISKNIAEGNWSDAFKLIGSGLAESAPVSIGMMLGGAEVGIARSAAGATALFAGPAIREQKENHADDSEMSQVLSGFGMAAAESVFSSIGEGSIGRVYKDIIKKEGIDQGTSIMKNGLVLAYQTALKKYGAPVAMAGEGLEEVATTITQNLIDNKKPFDNVLDSFISGVAGGGLYGSPLTIAKGISGFKDGIALHKVNSELKTDASNSMIEAFNPNTPVSQAQINITKIKGAPKVLSNQIKDAINNGEMTEDEGNKIKNDFAQTYGISNKLAPLNLLESKFPEAVQLSKEKNDLLRIVKQVDDKELTTPQLERIAEINTQLTSIARESAVANVETDINRAVVLGEKLGIMSKEDLVAIDTMDEVKTFLENNTKFTKEQINYKSKNSFGFFIPLENGKEILVVNKQLAAKNNMVTTGQHEFLHKLLYKMASKNPDVITGAGKNLYKYIENNITSEAFVNTEFAKRHSEYKKEFENTLNSVEGKKQLAKSRLDDNLISKEQYDDYITKYDNLIKNSESKYFEETFPLLSESISSGDIKYNETFFVKIGDMLRKALQNIGLNVSFKNGKDVFNFVRDYNKSFEKGEFTKAFKKLGQEGKVTTATIDKRTAVTPQNGQVIKESKLQSEELKQELADLKDEYDEGYGDMEEEEYLPKKQNLETKIKAALKKEAEGPVIVPAKEKEITEEDEVKEIIKNERGSLSSDKVQQIYDKKGKEGAQEIIDLFKPITKKIVDKRRDAPGFDRDLLTDEIETGVGGILDLITKYKPESGVPLAAYINKYLPMRAIATSKRVLDAEFYKDVTEEKDLVEEESITTGKEKPVYKNVLESNVFEPKVIKGINNKILSTVRTLKSKIDEPISLNRTVTPLVAEIRDQIGKQVDIDVKTAMGGKKDNQLRSWLIKNKKYILENMTTTFLMGADGKGGIPQAIQKSIDGKWLSYPEWVGKKVDRESVSTDLAGRTAGHDLVRRLPNVNNNISNEEYLSQVLEPDGNPIRGRKEALAKAVAEESAFDIIKDDFINEGPIYEAFVTNQERLGVELNNVVATEFARQVERGNVKESKASAINSGLFILEDNNWDFESEDYVDFVGKLSSKDKSYLTTFLKNNPETVDLANKYNEIWLSNEGVEYEAKAYKTINKYIKSKYSNKELGLEAAIPDRFNSTAPDMVFVIKKTGDRLITELKVNKKAPISSLTNSNVLGEISLTKEFFDSDKFIEAMNNSPERTEFIKALKSLPKEYIRYTKNGNLVVSNKGILELNRLDTNVIIPVSMQTIIDINAGKDLLQVGGNGLYKFKEIKGLENIPLLEGKAYLYSRFVFNSTSDRKGKYIGERLFARLDNNWEQKTNFDLLEKTDKTLNELSKVRESKALSDNFNKILEETKGIGVNEQFSDITARTIGAGKGKFRVFMSPSAEDFAGLLYDFMGKGTRGEEQKKFFEDNLLKPYAAGVTRINNIRANIKQGYRDLKKEHPIEAKRLTKIIEGTTNTYDQAVRVYLWDTNGVEIPGLSRLEIDKLVDVIKNDPAFTDFANKLSAASGQLEGWIKPTEYWNVESIVSDLHNVTEKGGRKQILGEFVENADAIFSPENLNKIEAARGTDFRSALEDSLFRMKNGTNRSSGDKIGSAWASWVNNSSGAIMFLNTRSAVLQLVASTNFINWSDNNPAMAAKAFANQPQYWKDFTELWNSNSLKERRAGLKSDVDQAELANAVEGSKNKVKAALAYLLKIGYTPTQMADSFAICSGGATFYRNRINTYEKQGMSASDAKDAAYKDFLATSEESQQSADPSKISQQQASSIGRLILAFGNTPMQYNRLMKKAGRDLINGRGDAKTHISKILYYGFIQSMIFSSLQSALFAVAFEEEPEDEKEKAKQKEKAGKKYISIANSMLDTILRGTGIYGAVVSTVKNTILEYLKQEEKGFKGESAKIIIAAAGISPPISSKMSKLNSAWNTSKYDKDIIKERGFSLMQDGKFNPSPAYDIAGKVTAATTNFPLDRLVDKANNVAEMLDERNKTWQKLALGLGWKPYDVGVVNEEEDRIKAEAKITKKFESDVKSAENRIAKKEALANRIDKMTDEQMNEYIDSLATAKEKAAVKKEMIWNRVEKNKNQ
jgi:hypothetical protein